MKDGDVDEEEGRPGTHQVVVAVQTSKYSRSRLLQTPPRTHPHQEDRTTQITQRSLHKSQIELYRSNYTDHYTDHSQMATNYSHQERNIRGVARAQREIQGEE